MKKNDKSKRRTKSVFLHTISSLPVEELVHRVQALEQNHRHIEIMQAKDDNFQFSIQMLDKNKKVEAEISGLLRRWNGTFTRVDITHIHEPNAQNSILNFLILVALLSCIAIFVNRFINPYYSYNFIDYIGSFLRYFILFAFLLGIFMGIVNGFREKVLSHNLNALRYKIDETMQALADKITETQSEALLEYDGSENSLAILLENEKFRHLSINSDGELDE